MTSDVLSPVDRAASLALWKAYRSRRRVLLADRGPRFDPTSPHFVVFPVLERLPDIDLVVQECRHHLGGAWGMQFVCRPELAEWVVSTVEDTDDIDVALLTAPEFRETGRDGLLRLPAFWDRLRGDHVLLVDHDTILRSAFPSSLLEYDFVAPLQPESWVGPWCRFGTGAVSYRSRDAMKRICESCKTRPALFPAEDVMVSIMLRLEGDHYYLPGVDVAAGFCVERCDHDDPFALHSTWKYFPPARMRSLLSEAPVPPA